MVSGSPKIERPACECTPAAAEQERKKTRPMFIIDAAADLPEALERLARLLYNIERGDRVYEWALGSGAAASPEPKAGFLSISVPGTTTAAPPAVVNYRPSVGFVYYVPGVDLPDTVRQVRTHLEALPDDHLLGYLPVEAAPHATLHHRGRIYSGSSTAGGRKPYMKGWYPGEGYPARHFHYVAGEVDGVPSHVSIRAAFTWYFLPVSTAIRIREMTQFAEFNAIVASVFLDTILGGKEAAEPVYTISADFFGIAPPPAGLAEALAGTNTLLIHHGGRFHHAGCAISNCLTWWKAPARGREVPFGELKLANAPPQGKPLCGTCEAPLSGRVFVLEDPAIAPYQLAVCVWCAGCLPAARKEKATRTTYPRTLAEAYSGTPLLGLLEADVEAIEVKKRTYFHVRPKNGESYFVEPVEGYRRATPPCLRVPELRAHRGASLGHNYLARLTK